MRFGFPLLSGILGAAAGWLVLQIVNRTTPGNRKSGRTEMTLVVIGSAALVAGLSVKFSGEGLPLFGVYAALVLTLIGVTLFDLRKHRIPHVVTIPGTIAGLILGSLVLPLGIRESLLGLVVGGGVLLAATLVETLRKKEIGGGDWKYAAMIGTFIGPQRVVIALVLTGVFGVLGGLILVAFGNHAKPHALGPWLSAGTVASILLG